MRTCSNQVNHIKAIDDGKIEEVKSETDGDELAESHNGPDMRNPETLGLMTQEERPSTHGDDADLAAPPPRRSVFDDLHPGFLEQAQRSEPLRDPQDAQVQRGDQKRWARKVPGRWRGWKWIRCKTASFEVGQVGMPQKRQHIVPRRGKAEHSKQAKDALGTLSFVLKSPRSKANEGISDRCVRFGFLRPGSTLKERLRFENVLVGCDGKLDQVDSTGLAWDEIELAMPPCCDADDAESEVHVDTEISNEDDKVGFEERVEQQEDAMVV